MRNDEEPARLATGSERLFHGTPAGDQLGVVFDQLRPVGRFLRRGLGAPRFGALAAAGALVAAGAVFAA
jgi:hypothetical protein